MAIKKTLAQNHLSDLSRKGRFGDTELVHVNPQEKSMLKAMGGSGGINPNTGLREYQGGFDASGYALPLQNPLGDVGSRLGDFKNMFSNLGSGFGAGIGKAVGAIGGAMPLVGLGLSLIGGYSANKAATEQAEQQSRLLSLQIKEQEGALNKLEPKKQAETAVALGEYQKSGESLGLSKSETEKQLGEVVKKSGLVTSAGVTEKKSTAYKQIGTAEKGIYGKLGQKLGGIEEWFEGEQSRIKGMIKSSTLQKQAADRAAGKKYLGIF